MNRYSIKEKASVGQVGSFTSLSSSFKSGGKKPSPYKSSLKQTSRVSQLDLKKSCNMPKNRLSPIHQKQEIDQINSAKRLRDENFNPTSVIKVNKSSSVSIDV